MPARERIQEYKKKSVPGAFKRICNATSYAKSGAVSA